LIPCDGVWFDEPGEALLDKNRVDLFFTGAQMIGAGFTAKKATTAVIRRIIPD